MESELADFPAAGRHYIDIVITILFRGKGNPFTVGRERCSLLPALHPGQAEGRSAGGRHLPEIAFITKNNLFPVGRQCRIGSEIDRFGEH